MASVETSRRSPHQALGRRSGRAGRDAQTEDKGGGTIAILFMVLILIPINLNLGGLRLTPARIMLLVMLLPLLGMLFSGKAGPVRSFDLLFLFANFWALVALIVYAGFNDGIESGGIWFAESTGAYLMGRIMVRNAHDFMRLARTYFWIIIVLLPFAMLEGQTGQPLILDMIRKVFPTYASIWQEKRMGFERAQVIFDHSILWGAFCAGAFGFVYYVINYGRSMFYRATTLVAVFWASFLSISGGAVVALAFQIGLFGWDFLTKRIPKRWTLLALLALVAYVVLDMLSNRNPFNVFISYLSFSQQSGYNRILIWRFGTASVGNFPFFGIGFGEWARPSYMSGSMDNFWLIHAVRFGLPNCIALILGIYLLMRNVGRVHLKDPKLIALRAAYLTSMGGMIFAGMTVHYWNALYLWFLFILGSGAWILNLANDETASLKTRSRRRRPGHAQAATQNPDKTASSDPAPSSQNISPRTPRRRRR